MLAVKYAIKMNAMMKIVFHSLNAPVPTRSICGWYNDSDNKFKGRSRVISLDGGEICFRIPDEFDVGNLPKIKKNWDGHTEKQKWNRIASVAGMKPLIWEKED